MAKQHVQKLQQFVPRSYYLPHRLLLFTPRLLLIATYGYIMHRSRIGVWIKLTSNFIVLGEGESRNLSSRYFSSSSSWLMRDSISIHSSQCLFKNYTTVLIRHSFHYATPALRHLVSCGGLGKGDIPSSAQRTADRPANRPNVVQITGRQTHRGSDFWPATDRRTDRWTSRRTDRLYVVFPPKFRTRRRRETTTPLRRCLTTLFHATTRKMWRLILLNFHRRF